MNMKDIQDFQKIIPHILFIPVSFWKRIGIKMKEKA